MVIRSHKGFNGTKARASRVAWAKTRGKMHRGFSVAQRRGDSMANARTGGFTGIETKFIDYTYGPTAIATAQAGAEADPTTADCISAIAQGDGESNRDGRKAVLKSLHVRGNVTYSPIDDGTTIGDSAIVRVIIVQDTQTNAVQENAEDVILPATNVEHAFRNLQFSKRFRILKDFKFMLNIVAAAAGTATTVDSAGVSRNFAFDRDVNIPVIHKATTAVVGAITDNSVHVIAFASRAGLLMSYESRVRFVG